MTFILNQKNFRGEVKKLQYLILYVKHYKRLKAWMEHFWQNLYLQIWQLVTLQSFDPQIPTVHLWKDLKLFKTYFWPIRLVGILTIGYSLSNWPHLHMAYIQQGCHFWPRQTRTTDVYVIFSKLSSNPTF